MYRYTVALRGTGLYYGIADVSKWNCIVIPCEHFAEPSLWRSDSAARARVEATLKTEPHNARRPNVLADKIMCVRGF